jgi:hypothetical protein
VRLLPCLALLLTLVVPLRPAAAADTYVRITKDGVKIRVSPTQAGEVVTTANRDDVFEFSDRQGDWYEIFMFSGESRYVHVSVADHILWPPEMPSDVTLRHRVFDALLAAEDRADHEATTAFASQPSMYIDRKRLLTDRYKLSVCHQLHFPACYSGKVAYEGVASGWVH